MNRAIFVVLLGVTVLMTGCARFANPAVAESGPAFDPALEGRWILRSDTESARVEIQIRRKGAEGEITARSDSESIART